MEIMTIGLKVPFDKKGLVLRKLANLVEGRIRKAKLLPPDTAGMQAWHWPSFYNVVTGKTLALPNLIALQHIPLSPAGVIAKRPAPIALPNSCAA